VVWETQYAPSDFDIYIRAVEEEGGLGTVHLIAATNDNESRPNVSGSESGLKYLVTWEKDNAIFGQEVNYDGDPITGDKQISANATHTAAISAGSTGDFLIAIEYHATSPDSIWGRLWGNRSYLPIIIR